MNNFEDGPLSGVFVEEMEDQDKYMKKRTRLIPAAARKNSPRKTGGISDLRDFCHSAADA